MSAILVPFVRPLKRGSKGPDVLALKRALKRAGYKRGIVLNATLGKGTLRQLHRFQTAQKLKPGPYTLGTHRKLARFYDSRGAFLLAKEKAELAGLPSEAMRQQIVAAMMLLYHNRDTVHYTQAANLRMQGVTQHLKPPSFPHYADCSAAATWAYYAAGAPDPNGFNFNGLGYTGTLAQHGKVVSLVKARPGDLVLYGPRPTFEHVAVYAGSDRVISHGSEAGPYILPIDYRSDRGEIRSYLP